MIRVMAVLFSAVSTGQLLRSNARLSDTTGTATGDIDEHRGVMLAIECST
jgi:hypothetical protein